MDVLEMSESGKALKALIRERGSEMLKELREFGDNSEWIAQRRELLRDKYPNKFIAVRQKKVVAVEESRTEVLRKIKEEYSNPDDIAIYFSNSIKTKLLL